jgi:hypothetical protein
MLWVVEQRRLWGDYGRVLISGYARREAPGAPLLLHRAGPFLPPISFPWLRTGGRCIVVSDGFRRSLEGQGIAGLGFRAAVKDRIVALSWHEWDRTAGDPEEYPPGGEPESYIWDHGHDAQAATRMPDAWELLPPVATLRTERVEDSRGGYLDRFVAYPELPEYPGFFASRGDPYGDLVVDETYRRWLHSEVGEWIKFCEVRVLNRSRDQSEGFRTN